MMFLIQKINISISICIFKLGASGPRNTHYLKFSKKSETKKNSGIHLSIYRLDK